MKPNNESKGRFCHDSKNSVCVLLKIKGIIQEKDISIVICPNDKDSHINADLANQLLIPEPSIIEKYKFLNPKGYGINNLQSTLDDYIFIFQFNVTTMYRKYADIILG